MPPKISIGSSKKAKKPPKPSASVKAPQAPKAKTASKPKRIAPEIPNIPLFRKGTESRAVQDAEIERKTSQNVLARLQDFMKWHEMSLRGQEMGVPKARYPKQISDSPQFQHCLLVMNSPEPVALLSSEKTRRGIISRFIDYHAPSVLTSKGNSELAVLEAQSSTQTLHDNIQHHIDECRGNLASGDLESASECLQVLEGLSEHATWEHAPGLLDILDKLKDDMLLLVNNPNPHGNPRISRDDTRDAPDSDSDGELEGDASDDDIDGHEDAWEQEL